MASKVIYPLMAAVGIATLGAAAWWYQNQPSKSSAEAPLISATTPGAQSATGKPSVEVARVEVMKLVDDAPAVGSLRSRQGVILRPEISGRITPPNLRDGDRLKACQLLVQLDDPAPKHL